MKEGFLSLTAYLLTMDNRCEKMALHEEKSSHEGGTRPGSRSLRTLGCIDNLYHVDPFIVRPFSCPYLTQLNSYIHPGHFLSKQCKAFCLLHIYIPTICFPPVSSQSLAAYLGIFQKGVPSHPMT